MAECPPPLVSLLLAATLFDTRPWWGLDLLFLVLINALFVNMLKFQSPAICHNNSFSFVLILLVIVSLYRHFHCIAAAQQLCSVYSLGRVQPPLGRPDFNIRLHLPETRTAFSMT